MKQNLLRATLIGLCCFYPVLAMKPQASLTRIEEYRDRNLWLQTDNPVGLLFNAGSSFSVAETNYQFTNGDLRTATEAASLHNIQIQTESYRSFKQMQFYGSFGYQHNTQNNRQWQTTLQPENHLINFGDTVPGRQKMETYHLCTGAALPLNRNWSIGARLTYNARTGRKQTDPRNQNDQIELSITPGILYRKQAFGIGAHLNYQRIAEKISYSIFNGESYDGRTFYPLWFGISENFQNGNNSSRSYQEERLGGAIQLWKKGRKQEWLSQWHYTQGRERCGISAVTGAEAGETERQELNWNAQARFTENGQQTFRPAYRRLVRTGYDPLQSLPEHSTEQSYLHYGRAKRAAIVNDNLSLDYTWLSTPDSLSAHQKAGARIEWQREQAQFFIYPATFTQIIRSIAVTACYHLQRHIRKQILDLDGEVTYKKGSGHLPDLKTENGYPLPEIKIQQKSTLLTHDFQVQTAETLCYSAAVQYTLRLDKSYALFSRVTINYLQVLSHSCPATHRLHCGLSAGLLF